MLTYEEALASSGSTIADLTQRLDSGLVPKDDIEAVTALRDGMRFGVSHKKKLEYDSGNSRREAIMAQRARHG